MPSSRDAEKGVLSSMLQLPEEIIGLAVETLTEDAFYVPAHRVLFRTLVKLFEQSKPVDPITLHQALEDANQLEEVGGDAAIAETYSFVTSAAHFEFYRDIVLEKQTLRGIITTCTECISTAYEDQENVAGLLDETERKILAIREGQDKGGGIRGMKDHVLAAVELIEKSFENKGATSGIATGFKDLDKMTQGLHGGEMSIIAARPSMGKTSFVMNIVEHISLELGLPTAVFSLEMSAQQLVQRLLCARAGVEMAKVRSGFLSQKTDFPKLMQAASELSKAQIYIDDTPAMSILEMRAKARRLKKTADIQMIAIDYLQLMKSNSKRGQENRQIEVAEISSGLKALAKELNVPVVVLAQLNRNPEQRGGGKPRLSDLRESGSIEQDADLVGLLVRSQYYADDAEEREETEGQAELIVAKQRNGPTGDVPLTFINKYMRFVDRARDPNDFE
ncbi:MAG: replicative DNA helicase [Verrucomicrobiales bacterium]